MSDRFFLEQPPSTDSVEFSEAEVQHLAKVMRVQPGDRIIAFDGNGLEYEVEVAAVSKKRVQGTIVSRAEISREANCRLTLGVALPKGERQRWLVEKCVELGVHTLIPLVTERGVAQPVTKAVERLRRTVIEASKQCGRNQLMAVEEGQSLSDILARACADGPAFILHPRGQPVPGGELPTATQVVALIGPEGGFSDTEVEQAIEAGCQAVSLGPRILRVETAALAIAAIVTLSSAQGPL